MMRTTLSGVSLVTAVACLAWVSVAAAQERQQAPAQKGTQDTQAKPKVVSDRDFVRLASAAGLAEESMGALAVKQGQSADVRKFGQRIVEDHGKANKELLRIANQKRMLPASRMDDEHQKAMDRLATLKGDAFDRAFIQQMVADHKEAVALFEGEAKNGQDADLKAFAAKTLPTLKDHLKTVQDLADKGKGGKNIK